MCSFQNWSDKKRDFYLLNLVNISCYNSFYVVYLQSWLISLYIYHSWCSFFGWPFLVIPQILKKKVLVSNSEGLLEPLSPYHIMCTKSDLPCMEHNPLLNLPPPPCDQGLAGRCRSYWPECNFPPSSFIITVILDSQRLIVMSEITIW